METSRGRKILGLIQNINLPKYESTRGLDDHQKSLATSRWNELFPKRNSVEYDDSRSEDKSSGSEYVPSDCSSDIETSYRRKTFKKFKKCVQFSKKIKLQKNKPESVSLKGEGVLKKISSCDNLPAKRCVAVVAIADSTDFSTPLVDKNNKRANILRIEAAKKTNEGKRIRDKRHSCYFCQTEVINIARHLEVNHEKEFEVAKLCAMPKCSKKRKQGFTEIVRAGNFFHNCNVISVKEGELILVRRPTANEIKFVSYNDYGPCPNCLGFMMKKHLWHHIKNNCTKEKSDENNESVHQNRHIIAESNAILCNVFGTEFTTDYKTNIINSLREDDVGNYCREDLLILKFGGMLFEKYGITQCELIRQLMRQISRLVLIIRDSTVQRLTLSDLLVPEKFDIIVQGTNTLCGSITSSSTKRPEFEIPSLALKIGHSLKKCANIERGLALRKSNLNKNETLMAFINLLELEWQIRISSNALAILFKRKLNVGQLLPITGDLKVLNEYIDQQMHKTVESLTKIQNIKNWNYLSTLTLCRIILFNKRRSGEAARMTTEQYATRLFGYQHSNEELKDSLTPYERKLAERLNVVNVIGKRGQKVPVILTPEVKASIDLLLQCRNRCGIAENNPYIFARSNHALSNMRGHDCLRKIVNEVELEKPAYITGTKLRKYVATVCQIFNLTENEHDWLARHLGHDITVHREFYRLHEDAVELTKVSRLLMAVDKGEASKFAGRSLNDIQIEDLPPVEEDDGDLDVENDESEDIDVANQTLDTNEPGSSNAETVAVDNTKQTRKSMKNRKSVSAADKRNVMKNPWTADDKRFVFEFFKIHIKNGIVPGKQDCQMCQEKYPSLLKRKWSDLKFCVKNQITKIAKMKLQK